LVEKRKKIGTNENTQFKVKSRERRRGGQKATAGERKKIKFLGFCFFL
jgi:hypothetical protein